MARNNQVVRQWHLLRRLEGSATLTLHELAAGLPDDLPKHLRTLRRDLEALETAGFPSQEQMYDLNEAAVVSTASTPWLN